MMNNLMMIAGHMKRVLLPIMCVALGAAACQKNSEEEAFGGDTAYQQRLLIAGSSTIAPFVTTVAEYLGATTSYPTPVVETSGTGGGFKLFCSGTDLSTSSIATASRKITASEKALCAQNGVTDIVEMKFGYDGIVFIRSNEAPDIAFSRKELFLALSRDVLIDGKFIPNPYTRWSEVNPSLPNTKIEVIGPPPTSGTRDAFAELVLEAGALQIPEYAALADSDPERFAAKVHTIRTDGRWTDAGENDTQIVQSLIRNTSAIGVVGFSYLDQSGDRVKAASIDDVVPSFENIVSGEYDESRSLYLYVKLAHIEKVPSILPFLTEAFCDDSMGQDGYLVERGLIPLSRDERKAELAKLEGQVAE